MGKMDNHRYAVPAVVIVVFAAESLSAVVGSDEEDRMLIPVRLFSGFEEESQGIVGIGDHLAEWVRAFGELTFAFGLHGVGVVRRNGENTCKERLREIVQAACHEL